MPTYMLLSDLTPHGRDASRQPRPCLCRERGGGALWLQGALAVAARIKRLRDVVEAPDNETVAHLSIDLGSRGTVSIKTFPAIEMEMLRTQLKGAHQLADRPVVGQPA